MHWDSPISTHPPVHPTVVIRSHFILPIAEHFFLFLCDSIFYRFTQLRSVSCLVTIEIGLDWIVDHSTPEFFYPSLDYT